MTPVSRRDLLSLGLLAFVAAARCPSACADLSEFGVPLCSLHGAGPMPQTESTAAPAAEAVQALNWIMLTTGLGSSFTILRGRFRTSATAYAMTRGGERFIVYDEAKFVWKPGAPNWRAVAILAHEIGHHLAGHTAVNRREAWVRELEADRFAGFVLSRLGASAAQANAWTDILNEDGSPTHPPRAARRMEVLDGWRQGEAMKRRERPACRPEWLGEPRQVGRYNCRALRVCTPEERVKIACGGTTDGVWKLK